MATPCMFVFQKRMAGFKTAVNLDLEGLKIMKNMLKALTFQRVCKYYNANY